MRPVSTAGVSGLLVISMIALAAPVLAAGVQRARVPDVVIEIVAGIVVGPAVLDWVKIDQPVGLVALLGLAFLLFLAGLEVDLKVITPGRLRAPLAGYVASLLLGSAAGFAFHVAGWVRSPLFLAITLSSSSLGLVVPVLADALQSRTLLGQLTIAGATLGEFGAITLLSLFFSATRAGTTSNVITFGIFGVAAAAIGLTLSRADRSLRLDAFLTRLQDTTAEIRVRIAIALLVGFVALAAKIGLQIILGAFLAGIILNIVDRDTASHPLFRTKLDALGYGFLIPVFFVSCGVEFDLTALTHSPSALAKIPLFLLALLTIRGAPAAFYIRTVGRRGAVAAGLLQATSLPVIVTAASIGVAIHAIPAVTASALVAAGLLSVLIFPAAALAVIGAGRPEPDEPRVTAPETDHPPTRTGRRRPTGSASSRRGGRLAADGLGEILGLAWSGGASSAARNESCCSTHHRRAAALKRPASGLATARRSAARTSASARLRTRLL
jgi:Kef-type K+ transport system membrane component KefB